MINEKEKDKTEFLIDIINTESLLKSELQKNESMLNLDKDFDSIVKFCLSDFTAFCLFLKENTEEVNERKILLPNALEAERLIFKRDADDTIYEHILEDEGLVADWVKWWWKKYMKRTMISNAKPEEKYTKYEENILQFTDEEREDLNSLVVYTLIYNGEICLVSVLAEMIIKQVLNQYSKNIKWTKEMKIEVTNICMREAKKISKVEGALLFISPIKNEGLREYRDKGTIQG